jgi:hypothetical protein
MYINKGTILNILLFLKRVWLFINKHFYILLIISTVTKYTNNKFYKYISWLVKIFVFTNIIFGVGYIIYFSVEQHSFMNGVSIYKDLISNYIDYIINLWNDLINIDVEESIIKNT